MVEALRPSSTVSNRYRVNDTTSSGTFCSSIPANEFLDGDLYVAQLAAGSPGDLVDGLCEGHQARARDLVNLPLMTGLGQSRDGDIRNVLRVDERLANGAGGQREHTVAQRVHEEALAEVLVEPTGTDDGPGWIRGEEDAFAALGLFFTSTRQ